MERRQASLGTGCAVGVVTLAINTGNQGRALCIELREEMMLHSGEGC